MSGEQIDRSDCYICGRGHPAILERHHIVPQRLGGSDDDVNIVELCPSCHSALENLYGRRFYASIGALSGRETVNVAVDQLEERVTKLQHSLESEFHAARQELESDFKEADLDDIAERELLERGDTEPDDSPEEYTTRAREIHEWMLARHPEDMPVSAEEVVSKVASEYGESKNAALDYLETLLDYGIAYEKSGEKYGVLEPYEGFQWSSVRTPTGGR